MKIGLSRLDYPEKRCIIGGENNEFFDLKYRNINLYFKHLSKRNDLDFYFNPVIFGRKVDSLVVFNDVIKTSTPWLSIFESVIPRHPSILGFNEKNWRERVANDDRNVRKRLELLLGSNCKALVAISNSAFQLQSKLLDFYPEYKNDIINKIHILPPPQKLFHDGLSAANDDKINFTFIGRDFYRKGGAEVVLAFRRLINKGYIDPDEIRLNIIGDLNKKSNYIFNSIGLETDSFYKEISSIVATSSFINYSNEVSNEDVLNILKNTDVGLLPTWGDTYGYSVLEMQAFNIPVITTNVRALPEINYSQLLIKSSFLNENNEMMISSISDRSSAREEIIFKLESEIVKIFDGLSSGNYKFNVYLDVKRKHDPKIYFSSLYDLFS